MLVWRIQPGGGAGEDPVDEAEFGDEDKKLADNALKFTMKGGVVPTPDNDGQDAEVLAMMYAGADKVTFKLLT